ncbi:MAG: response regulator transcription factor [Selenomonadaceae bacterium]|nr:response regulator transcription factor [Selenomonadaceae bacterium]
MRILVVDDDDMNLQMAQFILEKEFPGSDITCVDSGFKCISLLQKREIYDLILLDIKMPRMDGIMTLETIRAHQLWKDTPVAFLTASADKETVIKAGLLKVADYIKKPFTPKDLTARVKKILGERKVKEEPKAEEPAGERELTKEEIMAQLMNLGE